MDGLVKSMTVPSITTKTWTGASGEYFTHEDMARVEANLNTMAAFYGIGTYTFTTPSREGPFRYDDANKIEEGIKTISDMMGFGLLTDTNWTPGKSISYVDFNRWESNLRYIQEHGSAMEGMRAIHIVTSEALPTQYFQWTVKDRNGSVVATGSGSAGLGWHTMLDDTGTLNITSNGVSVNSTLLADQSTIDIMDYLCKLTINSTVAFNAVLYNNAGLGSYSGTTATVTVPRSTSTYLLELVMPESARYTGLSTAPLYEYISRTAYVTPNSSAVSVSLTPTKKATEVWITENGTLGIPTGTSYEIWAIGGGSKGFNHTSSDPYSSGGDGGRGGEIIRLTQTLSASSYSITIGAGGSTYNTAGGDTSMKRGSTTILTAHGGSGAGGGAGYNNSGASDSNKNAGSYYCGGGGGGLRTGNQNGGSAQGYGGNGGAYNAAGSNGVIVNGLGYGGAKGGVSGGGGGGGYGANGGAGANGCGGGGGGALGGNGGAGSDRGGRGGVGYGAGGGGAESGGGGGGGGLGSDKIANDGSAFGGNGASGAILIKYNG